jgi:hypothetical protein
MTPRKAKDSNINNTRLQRVICVDFLASEETVCNEKSEVTIDFPE